MQGESRSQVYLNYAEPQPIFVQASAIELAHIAERGRKSQSQFSCKRVQSRTCSGYAERSRKCQEKVHLYELNYETEDFRPHKRKVSVNI